MSDFEELCVWLETLSDLERELVYDTLEVMYPAEQMDLFVHARVRTHT